LDEAMQQQAAWIKKKYRINIAINLSARNLMEPDLISSITASLKKHDVSPADFTLEITESAVMRQPDKALQTIHDLKAMGFSLSLDDYGTGYTSLSYLKEMPVDELKIDQSFIFNCLKSEMDCAIVQSTIALVSTLGLKVVAEGIESKAVWERLKEMGCDKGQGYFIARPMPPEDFSQWLDSSEWSHS
jgi:EAL domain-containing protein (putative c-di-GMP-specific phosphodiesterase class I)